jgi:hypothetical protein
MEYESFGFIGISIYWRDLLTNLLAPGSDGIIIVFENECNPTFSFQVNGPEVDFLGRGDFHDPKYESMEISVSDTSDCPRLLVKSIFLIDTKTAGLFAVFNRPGCWILVRLCRMASPIQESRLSMILAHSIYDYFPRGKWRLTTSQATPSCSPFAPC